MSGSALSPASIRALLAAHDVHPSRALGQHFLADPNTARRIVRLAGIGPGDHVLEIGPGVGSLTVELARAGAHVRAIELDRHVLPLLEQVTKGLDVSVVLGDALGVDLASLLAAREWKVVSNLPYNVATPIVMRVLETAPMVTRMLVMVQREVGSRLAATPGGKEYGAVSVKVAYFAASRLVGTVPPTVFLPRPRVDSALVELVRHPRPPVDVPSRDALFSLVRTGFAQRRKMLRRALRPALGERTEELLASAGIEPATRAESLWLADWARLARIVSS